MIARRTPGAPAARQDEIERRLIAMWEDLLDDAPIGVDDSWFAVGGTSLLAVRLFTEIERELGLKLPLHTLLEGATVAHLAGVICRGEQPEWKRLVPIAPDGSKPPLVCVHAGELHVLFYRPLALALGPDQPVYGLEPVGLAGDRPPLGSIEEMAAEYVAELQNAGIGGPYQLLGFCSAGVVCTEMARQLEAAGEEVALVAVVDAAVPNPKPTPGLARRARRILRSGGARSLVSRVVAKVRRTVRTVGRDRPGAAHTRAPADAEQVVERACFRAFATYRPRPCRATLTAICSSEYANEPSQRRWDALSPEVDRHVVDAATHDTVLTEPHVQVVADILRTVLTAPAEPRPRPK